MGAEGSCCSGATDEALQAEMDRGFTGHGPRDIKASFSDLKEHTGEKSSQGQKSPHKFKGQGFDQDEQ